MITIEIKADSAEELQDHVLNLAKVMAKKPEESPEVETKVEIKEQVKEEVKVEPPHPPSPPTIKNEVKKKPGRPSKNQTSSEPQETLPVTSQVVHPVAPAPSEPMVTREQALSTLKKLIEKFGSEPGGKGILMGRELMNEFKVNKFVEIPEEDLPRFVEACLKRIQD